MDERRGLPARPTIIVRVAAVWTVADLRAQGVSRHVLASRLRDGRWRRILPGVVITHSSPLTAQQRRAAGLAYAGPAALLSHRSAAVVHGLRSTETSVEVTVPHGRPRPSTAFVTVHQSSRPALPVIRGGQLCTSVARTVIDVACGLDRLDDVRALVSDAVQRGHVTVEQLLAEAAAAPRHAPGRLRQALEEVSAGVRSAAEGAFLRLVRAARLPTPELGARVDTDQGSFYLDALWREHGVGAEIDGRAWHLDAVSWQRDLRRQNLIVAAGIMVLRFPATRVRDDPQGVVAELRSALRT